MNAVLTFVSDPGRRMSGRALSNGAAGGSRVIPFRPLPRPATLAAFMPPAREEEVSRMAEPAPQPVRLARLIRMASVGGYIAVHNDTLVELDGRVLWPTAEALIRDASAAGVPVSTYVIDTARP